MNDPKPFLVLWSKAAVTAAGSEISALQSKLVEEVSDITSGARAWFLHAIPGDGEDMCYECTGSEMEDTWKVFVQTAHYKPTPPIREDHPDTERRGKVINFPEVNNEPDNEVFAAFEDIIK